MTYSDPRSRKRIQNSETAKNARNATAEKIVKNRRFIFALYESGYRSQIYVDAFSTTFFVASEARKKDTPIAGNGIPKRVRSYASCHSSGNGEPFSL